MGSFFDYRSDPVIQRMSVNIKLNFRGFENKSTNCMSVIALSQSSPLWECTAITDESFHALTRALSPWSDSVLASAQWTDFHFSGCEAFPGIRRLRRWLDSSDDPETLHRLCLTTELDVFDHNCILEVCFPHWFYFTYHKIPLNLLPIIGKKWMF